VQALNGQIGTLDNRSATAAKIDIKGQVDRYAPVTISGSLTPFDFMSALDIKTRFERVELTTLTPYSGKFAGYRIRKGKLDLDLHYRINKGQLQAENTVVVEQLQLGEKVDSPDAVSLPLKLAIALLKDSHGRIALSLPVSGDLKNPQFSVMPIVWQTLRNLMLRAAQAPFKFIGGLVAGGGSQDLGSIAFAPGSSDLDGTAQAALGKLSSALKERPALHLEVEGASAQASDGPILAEHRLQREYQGTYYKMLQRRGDKVPADASTLQVPDDEKPALLEAIYRTRLKRQPPEQWAQLPSDARSAQLRAAVIESWEDSTALLRELGQARAASIKDFLVRNTQLGDERIFFVDANIKGAVNAGQVVTQLHLGAD
jgi:outer membrane protein OmpA-like peptidoglycan-associated protein